MNQDARKVSPIALRLCALLVPPIGLVLLWISGARTGRKILGTIGILLYSLIYAAGVIFLLLRYGGMEVEWRGGYLPALTFHKTEPDYSALDRHRAAKKPSNSSSASAHTEGAVWPGYRGPDRDGHAGTADPSAEWLAGKPRLLWRQPCGGGYASFAIARGLAFTIEQRRENEVVIAYDLNEGHEVWTNSWPAHFSESMGGDGPRATPTFDDGRVYALGGEGELRCLDAKSGEVIWSTNILTEARTGNITYGMAASPLVFSNTVIVQPGGGNGSSVVALDKQTGQRKWGALDDGAAYSSPMLATLAGQQGLLIVTATRAVVLEPATGKSLWEFPWVVQMGNRNIAQPVIMSHDRFFLSAGYGTGCTVVELRQSGGLNMAQTVWKNKFLKNKFTSSVARNGFIYGLDEDILTCLDASTGERKWKGGRYGYGQLLLAGAHLIVLSGEGELAVVKADPAEFNEVSRFQAIHGKTWNHPAIGGGRLLIRNSAEMACYEFSH
jgi:outer membrane protein assembly factor BamB